MSHFRIGQIVPSSNTTMETEIPELMRRHAQSNNNTVTFHSSRMRMKKVSAEELAAMDSDSLRCAAELADARVDVMGYACLVAIMSMKPGYHRESQKNLQKVIDDEGANSKVVSSAGALIEGLAEMGAKKISIVTPYVRPLTDLVAQYIENEGVEVQDAIALGISDNLEVGLRNPFLLHEDIKRLDTRGVDAVVISACVQMPSLPAIPDAEGILGLPVTSAAVCTVRSMLKALGQKPFIEGGGAMLSGKF